jgi:Mn-containing catalase
MISRFDKIAVDLPRPKNPSANDAAAIQELLGGRFGEMSTLMNYTYQSFNFRGRNKLRPFYDLIASIPPKNSVTSKLFLTPLICC